MWKVSEQKPLCGVLGRFLEERIKASVNSNHIVLFILSWAADMLKSVGPVLRVVASPHMGWFSPGSGIVVSVKRIWEKHNIRREKQRKGARSNLFLCPLSLFALKGLHISTVNTSRWNLSMLCNSCKLIFCLWSKLKMRGKKSIEHGCVCAM